MPGTATEPIVCAYSTSCTTAASTIPSSCLEIVTRTGCPTSPVCDSFTAWKRCILHPDIILTRRIVPNDTTTYNSSTGHGAIGVEFGGTAVSSPSPFGAGIAPGPADELSQKLVQLNPDLQWSEGSYRGFYTLEVSTKNVTATYYAMRNLSECTIMFPSTFIFWSPSLWNGSDTWSLR